MAALGLSATGGRLRAAHASRPLAVRLPSNRLAAGSGCPCQQHKSFLRLAGSSYWVA